MLRWRELLSWRAEWVERVPSRAVVSRRSGLNDRTCRYKQEDRCCWSLCTLQWRSCIGMVFVLCCLWGTSYKLQASVAEARVQSQANPCDISGGQCVTVTGFSPSISVFPCQYHSTNVPYPFIHLPPTLYNVSLPVFQFSPVSNIPPMLHTHSFTYHPHYIMFLSQYFSFPLSVSFHQCSIPIHSPTTHTI